MANPSSQAVDQRAGEAHGGPKNWRLYFGLLVAPFAWILQLLANFALASHACYPGATPRNHFLAGWENVWAVLLGINVFCIILALVALAISAQNWRRLLRPRRESDEHAYVLEPGEGRVRVFSASSILISLLFAIAILFNTFTLWLVSSCAQL